MKRFAILLCILVSVAVSAFAADPGAVTPAAPSLLTWVMANSTAVFGVALAISEFMALIPGFQGNGILDAIIKALSVLSKKPE